MPAAAIDFSAVTDIIHFSVVPNTDGTLNSGDNDITLGNSTNLVKLAHAAGVKVLICVGGGGSESAFQAAASAGTLTTFVNNLTNFVAARGYDGVDIDWEPLPSTDFHLYTNLVTSLRGALNKMTAPKLITAAAAAYPPYGDLATGEYLMYAGIQSYLDQINIMTYDLSGPYDGWVTWHNSPIYDGGYHFPNTSELVPSINASVTNFLGNGVAATKIAPGMAFYGYVWTGGAGAGTNTLTGPRESWTSAPTITAYGYRDIIADYYKTNLYAWDTNAQAAYLGITNAVAANNVFLSYDDARACQAKVSYARNNRLGGVMIWELGQDHTANVPDPLLQAVKLALATPGLVSGRAVGQDILINFNTAPLGSYAVQWSGNLAAGLWNSLLTTNVTGVGGVLQVRDAGAMTNQAVRFYRIVTSP